MVLFSNSILEFTDFADYPSTICRSYGSSTDCSNHLKGDEKSVRFDSFVIIGK